MLENNKPKSFQTQIHSDASFIDCLPFFQVLSPIRNKHWNDSRSINQSTSKMWNKRLKWIMTSSAYTQHIMNERIDMRGHSAKLLLTHSINPIHEKTMEWKRKQTGKLSKKRKAKQAFLFGWLGFFFCPPCKAEISFTVCACVGVFVVFVGGFFF